MSRVRLSRATDISGRTATRPRLIKARCDWTSTGPIAGRKDHFHRAFDLKSDMEDAVAVENFRQAARLRDELSAQFSPLTQMEVEHAYRLRSNYSVSEKVKSLQALSELQPCFQSQECIAKCLPNEHLVVSSAQCVLPLVATIAPVPDRGRSDASDQNICLVRHG
jgi:UvrB/uvrC motif